MDTYKYEVIRKHLKDDEILAQLAEEAAELSQAALKLRRALAGVNPTPVSKKRALNCFIEEMADVDVAMNAFLAGFCHEDTMQINETWRAVFRDKLERWEKRLEKSEHLDERLRK